MIGYIRSLGSRHEVFMQHAKLRHDEPSVMNYYRCWLCMYYSFIYFLLAQKSRILSSDLCTTMNVHNALVHSYSLEILTCQCPYINKDFGRLIVTDSKIHNKYYKINFKIDFKRLTKCACKKVVSETCLQPAFPAVPTLMTLAHKLTKSRTTAVTA